MKTIRKAEVGSVTLRLVEKGGKFVGIILANGAIRNEIEGTSADDVWSRTQ